MKLSISNIAWDSEHDEMIYEEMKTLNYSGLEIAPTRILTELPYDKNDKIMAFSEDIQNRYGLCISSMQSIWYGRNEKLFGSNDEYMSLVNYTKKAIDFAASANCKNLVFGCPKNRIITYEKDLDRAIEFLEIIGEYAIENNTFFSIEANPVIYGTNFINTTDSAFKVLDMLKTKGVRINLDLGTIIYNNEHLSSIEQNIERINHIHISEPNLEIIKKRQLHYEIANILKSNNYDRFVSIEMKKHEDVNLIIDTMKYIMEVFN